MSNAAHLLPQSAGALAFSPDGILFVGDSKLGAVFAFETGRGEAPASLDPFIFESIEETIGAALGVPANRLVMNGMAVHPTTRESHISIGVRRGDRLEPALVRVSLDGTVHRFDLASPSTLHRLSDVPDEEKTFQSRAGFWPVPPAAYYDEKARTPMRSMAIVDLKVHGGEVFVAGVSNQEFSSTLRRIPHPFTGVESETQLEVYHVAHGNWETRAPIRAMQFATLDGEDTLIAAYACSPLVTIPVAELKGGAKVRGKTIGDMGNGQPISLVAFRDGDEDKLFVTNMAHGPRIIPLKGLEGAEGFTDGNRLAPGMLVDTSPVMPAGPIGKEVCFVGASLRADLFSERFFVSLTRQADTGALTLETLPVGPLPARFDTMWVEFDFPGFKWPASPAA